MTLFPITRTLFEGTSTRNCDKRNSATETQKREGGGNKG